MDIVLARETIDKMGGTARFKEFGYTDDDSKWRKDFTFNLMRFTKGKTLKFREVLKGHKELPRIPARLRDIDAWLAVLEGEKVRCKSVKNFEPMLKQYLKGAPKHWVYEKREDSDVWQPYYVGGVKFVPRQEDRYGHVTPAHVTVTLYWEELADYHDHTEIFWAEDCEDLTVGQALANKGWYVENDDRLKEYGANVAHYDRIFDKVGLQCLATGVAEELDKKRSYWSRIDKIRLDKDGQPARIVVDVLSETDEEKEAKGRPPSAELWGKEACDHEGSPDDDDTDLKPGDEDEDQEDHVPDAEIPLKPAIPCFDLKRHARLKIYADQLTVYRYDTSLSEKLILPDEVTDLVDLLVSHKGGFKDIIGNKGQGAVILCAGRPGTGKTLTAEVYSEAMERPLYSVQCSQLGTDPDDLEKELLVVFARAVRWNAILLLDEADVYVASRGSDLTQNAIVGVFLRVLEYYGGVMFMTTNRSDLVDDAVASRCLARIDYKAPTPANQKRIWRTLADTAGIEIDDAEVDAIVKAFPDLSGRDVKNLLKLSSMVAAARRTGITLKMVKFVKQFKPTSDGADQ